MSFRILLSRSPLRQSIHAFTRPYATTVTKAPQFQRRAVSVGTAVGTGRGKPSIVEDLPNTSAEMDTNAQTSGGTPASEAASSSAPSESLQTTYAGDGTGNDWSRSYHGLSSEPFAKEVADVLQAPIDPLDIEVKPGKGTTSILESMVTHALSDGLIYLPEIKYRRILNKAFGPGGWGLAPRSETNVGPKVVSREYALVCLGRCVLFPPGFPVPS